MLKMMDVHITHYDKNTLEWLGTFTYGRDVAIKFQDKSPKDLKQMTYNLLSEMSGKVAIREALESNIVTFEVDYEHSSEMVDTKSSYKFISTPEKYMEVFNV